MSVVLLLHDVYGVEGPRATGFPGGDADRYKLSAAAFRELLTALDFEREPGTAPHLFQGGTEVPTVALTFDDGGVGAIHYTADLLEEFGWRGYFFIVGGRLGYPGFLTGAHLRELHGRGHVIGTHSQHHPIPITSLPEDLVRAEWTDSIEAIASVTGAPVRTGSIPGGGLSARVARAAAKSGLEVLFTSEPTTRLGRVGACRLVGRFAVYGHSRAQLVASIVRGSAGPRAAAWLSWNARKLPKVLAGPMWLALRHRILRRHDTS